MEGKINVHKPSFIERLFCCSNKNQYLIMEHELIINSMNKNQEHENQPNNLNGSLDGLFLIKVSKKDKDLYTFIQDNKNYISTHIIKIAIECNKNNIPLLSILIELLYNKISIDDIESIFESILDKKSNFGLYIQHIINNAYKLRYNGIIILHKLCKIYSHHLTERFIEKYIRRCLSDEKYKVILNQLILELTFCNKKIPYSVKNEIIYYANLLKSPTIINNLDINYKLLPE